MVSSKSFKILQRIKSMQKHGEGLAVCRVYRELLQKGGVLLKTVFCSTVKGRGGILTTVLISKRKGEGGLM